MSSDQCISCQFLKLFGDTKSSNLSLRPLGIFEAMKKKRTLRKILDGRMQDAREFLMSLADEMEMDNHSFKWFDNFVANVRTTVKCFTCNSSYHTDDYCGNFVVDVDVQTVQRAMDSYFEWEFVFDYFCVRCEKTVTAKKMKF